MAKVGAQRAAELTGRSKSTVQRAMKAGKLSYEVDNNGRRVIDVAELDRAFGLLPPQGATVAPTANVESELEKATQMFEIERLKTRIRMLEDQLDAAEGQLDDLKEQRDQWQKQAQQVLITSQYSQKQAEELKTELKERERRARIKRQQELERKVNTLKNQRTNENEGITASLKSLDFKNVWQKIRGDQADEQETAPAAAADKKTA